jgi:hypothetical protein
MRHPTFFKAVESGPAEGAMLSSFVAESASGSSFDFLAAFFGLVAFSGFAVFAAVVGPSGFAGVGGATAFDGV